MTSSAEEALFALALAKPATERAAWLDRECGNDRALRQRLEVLLAAHEEPERLLSTAAQPIRPLANLRLSPAPDEAIGQSLGPYKLLERVGEGGFGVVYVAEQSQPVRRRVALKIIKLGMDTQQVVARFDAERQALAMMDHPNIAKVFDAGTTDTGRPYFVMEWVRGIPITDYCDQNRLSIRDRLELFIKVCHAIQHAHQKGIIHRDIKPSNILVAFHDGAPVPKVIDFGIAKATAGRLTEATLNTQLHHPFLGTPAYMSPEQADLGGLDVDTRGDIYSLGVLLYELLTGTTPFDARELMNSGIDAMLKTIRHQEPPRPSTRLTQTLAAAESSRRTGNAPDDSAASRRRLQEMVRHLQGDLDWVVMKCLEKDRQRRYETANGLAAELKRHLANEPVVARPPSTAYKFRKAFRRNRLSFLATGAVAVALVIGIALSTWQMFEARNARGAEREQRLAAQAAQQQAEAARIAERQERLRADAEKLEAQRHLYAANMSLAQQAWEQPHFDQIQHLLVETASSPFRGFEWYYWQRQMHLAVTTLHGHLNSVHAVAFSPDGRRLVTGSGDHTAKVWEAATGRELLTFAGHSAQVWSVAFFPDGRRIVTGSADQTARVWDATTGRELFVLQGHPYRIYDIAVSPDGQRIATPSGDRLKIWSATDGRELRTLQGHTATIYSVAFSPDGRYLLTGSGDRTAQVWDAATGMPLLAFKGHDQKVDSVAFLPDGRRIVTGSSDRTAKLWELSTGRELMTLIGHTAVVPKVVLSPDGRHVLTGSEDFTAKLWDSATGR
ncbi:MAG: serine/threonine protein kinase, partial [Verrucomicrobiales bacterium]|nr:serine/threonine protein kinase [Verrucomicrobiales bacterium]